MRNTLITLKKSASSTRWLARQAKDPYVKGRNAPINPSIPGPGSETAYRSRSSFKLVSLLEKYPQLLAPPHSPTGSSDRRRRDAPDRASHDHSTPELRAIEEDGVQKLFSAQTVEEAMSSTGDSKDHSKLPGNSRTTRRVIVDLGAAPGGWSQVLRSRLRPSTLIYALDILDMEPIRGVQTIEGNFLEPTVQRRLRELILTQSTQEHGSETVKYGGEASLSSEGTEGHEGKDGLVDLVLSDMMGPMSGNKMADLRTSLDLVEAATTFAFRNLRSVPDTPASTPASPVQVSRGRDHKPAYPGGHLVMKFFMHPDMTEYQNEVLKPNFRRIALHKPKESRKESSEAYFVCLGYKGQQGM